jgi:hypothetical protein
MTVRGWTAMSRLLVLVPAVGIVCQSAFAQETAASRISGTITRPVEVKQVQPICKGAATISAIFEAVIDKEGLVHDAKLIEGERSPSTDAALAALVMWRYLPTRLNDAPVGAIWHYELSGCRLTPFDTGRAASADLAPNEPYFDWGACPFEGCVYRKWTAMREVVTRAGRSRESEPTAIIGKGQSVVAVSGVVITTRVGKLRATSDLELGSGRSRVTVRKGDVIYVLSYLGESAYTFWYRGQRYADHQYLEPTGEAGRPVVNGPVELIQPPVWDWWSWVERDDGAGGWVHGSDGFDGSDRYGG